MQTNYNLIMLLMAYLGSRKREDKGGPEGEAKGEAGGGGQRGSPQGEAKGGGRRGMPKGEPEVGGQSGVSRISKRGGRSGGQRGARRGKSKGIKLSHPLVYHATM